MSDSHEESRKGVPDKGSLNRERLVTKAKFPSCTRVSPPPPPTRTGTESPRSGYTDNPDDRYSGKVLSNKRKTRVVILKIILSLTGSQRSALSRGLTCSCLLIQKTTFAEWFSTFSNDHS